MTFFTALSDRDQRRALASRDNPRDAWCTPPETFASLARQFGPFSVDAFADAGNALCGQHLRNAWTDRWYGAVFANPPFICADLAVRAAWNHWAAGECASITMLLPANRTATNWWLNYVETQRDQLGSPLRTLFLSPRVAYVPPPGVKASQPAFGSVVLDWRQR
jgi:hypothetical protein